MSKAKLIEKRRLVCQVEGCGSDRIKFKGIGDYDYGDVLFFGCERGHETTMSLYVEDDGATYWSISAGGDPSWR